MTNPEDILGRPMAEGHRAHRDGLLLGECPYGPGHIRRLWRAGWLEREQSFLRVAAKPARRGQLRRSVW
jgi:ribosome modulation factor